MITITSVENEKVKKFRKLQSKKYREQYNQYLVEGEHLVYEAYKRGVLQELLLVEGRDVILPVPYNYYSKAVMNKISSMDNPPTVMGLCNKYESDEIKGDRILILDGIQDPGNMGTIIRSAVAFNIDTIILTENTVDLYNSKVLRATQGMFYHINIVEIAGLEVMDILKNMNIPVYGTNVCDGIDARCLSSEEKEKFALVMGNEGNGVRDEMSELCTKNLYIRMNKNAESLNVGIAASILMYELGR